MPAAANNFTASATIPSDIASGSYVLRHEIIALHGAGTEDGAQNYPQCKRFSVCPYVEDVADSHS